MEKKILISLFFVLVVANTSFGKICTFGSDVPEIFISGKYDENKKVIMDYLYIKTFIKDTLINNIEFKKFQWDKFKNYREAHQIHYEFQRFTDEEFILLDGKLKIVHKLKPKPETQTGILYGTETEITYKSGKDALSEKFSLADNEVFILLNIKDKKFGGGMNGIEFKQILTGGAFEIAAKILTKKDSAETDYNIQPGDELQFVYIVERVGFSSEGTLGKDNSFKTEEKKLSSREEVITMKCTDVNNENGKKNLHFNIRKFSSEKNTTKESSSMIKIDEEGNVSMDDQVIAKEQTFKLDFKIETFDGSQLPEEYRTDAGSTSYFSFTGITNDTLSSKAFPKALYINSINYYTAYYLCYFPMFVAEYPGTKAEILYVKLNNKEYGNKR